MKKLYITLLFILTYFNVFSQEEVKTDSTIISDVKPTSELNLWYGHDQLELTEVVILKDYLLVFDDTKNAIFLIDNASHLIIDTLNLKDNLDIKPISYRDFKTNLSKLSSIDPLVWKSAIINDTTIWIGSILYKQGAGGIKITIENKKIKANYELYQLKSYEKDFTYDNHVFPYSKTIFNGNQIYSFTSIIRQAIKKKQEVPLEGIVVSQLPSLETKVIYKSTETPKTTAPKVINLFVHQQKLLLFSVFEQRLTIFNKEWNRTEIELKDYFSVPNFRYAAFLVDIISQKLYMSISTKPPLATSNLQSIYEVTFPSPQEIKLDFVRTFDLRQMKVKSIDNNHIYLWNPKNGFIYTYKIR